MSTFMKINIIVVCLVLVWMAFEGFQYFKQKKAGVDLTADEFKKDMRRAQIIDLREKDDYQAGHILGARNIPYIQLKHRINELRKDTPVYLYENKETLSRRASALLQKEGYTQVFRLKDGYSEWDGRIKRS